MKNHNYYIYIQPHIIGNLENWGYSYDTDYERFSTREKAQRHGENTLGHDDFWVAEVEHDKVIALYSNTERRSDKAELAAINREGIF